MDMFKGCEHRTLKNGLQWLNEPTKWQFDDEGLTVVPEGHTDFFRPYAGTPNDNACLLYTEISGDFTIIAHVQAHLAGFGDAGAVTVRASADRWLKLCLERSPKGEVSVVSVVTNPWSDDSNGELLEKPECYLRLTRKSNVFGMHYSLDGVSWRFVRTLGFEMPDTVMGGIHAQAPFGAGCQVTFSSVSLGHGSVGDFRSGE